MSLYLDSGQATGQAGSAELLPPQNTNQDRTRLDIMSISFDVFVTPPHVSRSFDRL